MTCAQFTFGGHCNGCAWRLVRATEEQLYCPDWAPNFNLFVVAWPMGLKLWNGVVHVSIHRVLVFVCPHQAPTQDYSAQCVLVVMESPLHEEFSGARKEDQDNKLKGGTESVVSFALLAID